MLKVAYLIHYNGNLKDGVGKKILSQIKFWMQNNINTELIIITKNKELINSIHSKNGLFSIKCFSYADSNRLKTWKNAIEYILINKFNFVYFRYDLFYPSMLTLFKKIPTVVEINTNDIYEFKHTSIFRNLYNQITRNFILKNVKGMIFVTKELQESKEFAVYLSKNVKSLVIGNGIDLDKYKTLPLSSANQEPRIVFLGTDGLLWHGVDKIIKMAELFPKWTFDIIGLKGGENLKKGLSNVNFLGFLEKKDYEKILEKADIAIGTLALHRKGMNEASPLKVREYLAYGLPVIIAYNDTDFNNDHEFILKLPNTENNIIENKIVIENFVNRMKGVRVAREKIKHIDIKVKEKQRINFFYEILNQKEDF